MIKSIGLFWRRDQVYWGAGSQAGALLGVPASGRSGVSIDFRTQIGIYVLYSDYDPVYVGQAGSGHAKLFARLKHHRKDDLAERWNRFSWFGLRSVLSNGNLSAETQTSHAEINTVLDHVEAILIHAIEPPMNRQSGRFGQNVVRYLQVRDERLGPTQDEMMKEIWESTKRI